MMHEPEKSDSVVVAVKLANKTEQSVAEPMEAWTNMHVANFYDGAILEP